MSSKLLQCPDCGGKSFNWILEIVQKGSVHKYDDGSIDGEGMELGEVVGSDMHDGVWCQKCDDMKALENLVVGYE